MSHAYPLARTAADALNAPDQAARTLHEAARLAGDRSMTGLVTEWVSVAPAEAEEMMVKAEQGVGDGFIQRYEDADGQPVLAITYWQIGDTLEKSKSAPPKSDPPEATEPDHTDDLYFREGRTKKRRRRRSADPNQLDLFKPDIAPPEEG